MRCAHKFLRNSYKEKWEKAHLFIGIIKLGWLLTKDEFIEMVQFVVLHLHGVAFILQIVYKDVLAYLQNIG